jgi:hypothetical protein
MESSWVVDEARFLLGDRRSSSFVFAFILCFFILWIVAADVQNLVLYLKNFMSVSTIPFKKALIPPHTFGASIALIERIWIIAGGE